MTHGAFVLLGWVPAQETRDIPLVSQILRAIPAWLTGQIRSERHYSGGFGIGAFVVESTAYTALRIGLVSF